MFALFPTKQCWDVIGGLVEHEVELSVSLVHLISLQQTETGSAQQVVLKEPSEEEICNPEARPCCIHHQFEPKYIPPYLIVHDDLVGHGVEQGGLRDELFLGIFILLFAGLLNIVGCQRVETGHLVLLMVSVVQVSINSSSLQKLHEVLRLPLFVVLQLQTHTGETKTV